MGRTYIKVRPIFLELIMKSVTTFILAVIFTVVGVMNVSAQSTESIWLSASTNVFKTQETVTVNVNATSATPVQGFTFQIRYDPNCLKPVNASSTIPGMNALALPQTSGLVDGSYASTTPQMVNGVLAEVRFTTLGGCNTNLMLESAALAIRNESGFAAPLAGVTLGERNIALNIDKEVAAAQSEVPVTGSVLPLEPTVVTKATNYSWILGLLAVVFVLGCLFVAFKYFKMGSPANTSGGLVQKRSSSSQLATLHMKRGPQAGKSIVLKQLPIGIGRDPRNEVCLNDPNIGIQHARIFTSNNDYYLMDLSGNTFINGQAVRNSSVVLKPGDVVRLGKSALFVFGS
jgi:hypothetical protein